MSRTLSGQEKAAAAEIWSRVFNSPDPFGWPFSSRLGSGRILFPTDGCHLTSEQFETLAAVVAKREGTGLCYLAVVEGLEKLEGSSKEMILQIDLSDYESYQALHLTIENAIYSMSGGWGVLLSHEMHAVVGGEAAFISDFNQMDDSSEEQWSAFLAQWSGRQHAKWVESISSHRI
jgi:hypothetical protein